MIAAVADTHAVLWFLSADARLSAAARQFMEMAIQRGDEIAVSAISLIEIVYLVEKGKIPPFQFSQLSEALGSSDSMFVQLPVTLEIARTMTRISAASIPDMPDRVIAATALQTGVPVISRDSKIRHSTIISIW